MQRLIVLGAVLALASARPEMYKEKEDFQYSRSSSDEGTKSGYYGAQRGNMGGNYEKAHNMDNLAQNQMSGLIKQVEGDLGDGSKMRAGSVYTAANSRGTYGSGHYDLSNLAGRNFQESSHYDNSQARSSQSSSAFNSAGYTSGRSQSALHSGYQTAGQSGLNLQSGDLQSIDNTQGSGLYDYGRHSSHSTGYQSQSGFREHSAYDLTNSNLQSGGYGSNTQTRLISATPVRIIVRPGTRVAIPVAAQTYDITHGSSLVDQNTINTDTETVSSSDNQHTVFRPTASKHYESSYNYRKEWEKHDTVPSTVVLPTPTQGSFPVNSELYEDSQLHTSNGQYDASRLDSQSAHSSNVYSGYTANVKSATSQARSNYGSQNQGSNLNVYTAGGRNSASNYHGAEDTSMSGFSHNTGSRYYGATADASSLTQAGYNAGLNTDLNSQVENLNGKPKSYQSSYSYHKSWERQGDPYVIKPASSAYYDGQTSQRLSSSTKNMGYALSGSHYQHQGVDCDENGHIRVARSYNNDEYQQQSQNIEDLGQQVVDLGQESQNNWDQQETQQSQNSWDKLEDLGQQSQNKWDRIEDLGQQTQNTWGQQETQQSQSSWDKLEDLGQQSQNKWDRIEDLGQQTQNNWGQQITQQSQNSWDKLQDINQQTQNLDQQNQNDLGQQIQDKNSKVDQQTQTHWDFSNSDQQTEHKQSTFDQQETSDHINIWNKFDNLNTYKKPGSDINIPQPINHRVPQIESMDQQLHNSWSNINTASQSESSYFTSHNSGYYNVQNTDQHNYFKEQGRRNESANTFDKLPPAPLSSLWNKLNQQSILNTDTGFENTNNANNLSGTYESTQNTYSFVQEQSNSSHSTIIHQHQYNKTTLNNEQPKVFDNIPSFNSEEKESEDIGRGDIGPIKPLHSVSDEENEEKHVIENDRLSVMSLDQQKSHNNMTISNENNDAYRNINTGSKLQTTAKDILEQTSQEFGPFQGILQEGNLEQKNMQNSKDFSQQENMEQDLEHKNANDFGVNGNLEQQNLEDFGQQVNLAQQNLEDFGQNLNVNLDQQNLEDFAQHENLEQQTLQDFKQQNVYDLGQHNNQEQQNLQDFGQQHVRDLNQHENLEHQNLQDFAQQNVHELSQHNNNLEQQNLQDFGQQNVHDLSQHGNLEQQNLQDFGQQNFHDLSQHDNLEQQNLQDFEQQNVHDLSQHDNLEQQNLQDFGQQNVHDLSQHNNLKQQNLEDFGQQNVHDLSQHNNLEQQNLEDFGQQNVHDLSQHDTLEQQHLQDFGQQQNIGQHLEQFAQVERLNQENLEQQNVQYNGIGRESVNDFGSNYYKEHQHIQNYEKFGEKKENHIYEKDLGDINSQVDSINPQVVDEPVEIKKQNNIFQSISPKTEVTTPIEPTTEKPGFWKSVGNKFSSAKSTVASWFKS